MDQAFSVRQSLQGALQDFVRESGFSDILAENLMREIVGILAAYREEGQQLFPEIYVLADVDCFKAIAPGAQQLTIGTIAAAREDAAAVIIKQCAPLARGGWAQFVICENSTFHFGLFRASRHSLAIPAEEVLQGLDVSTPVILIRNRGHLVVDLRSTSSRTLSVSLTTQTARPSELGKHVAVLAASISLDVKEPLRYDFEPYLRRMLTGMLQRCHGTLVGVVKSHSDESLAFSQSDCICPDPTINLSLLHQSANESKTADSLAELNAAESLIEGMMNSDGLIVFGTDGSLLAFKAFLMPEIHENMELTPNGGGRRRAYRLMESRLGRTFKAILFRSQDGETKCKGDQHASSSE